MSKLDSAQKQPRYKKWLINIFILILATGLMLAVGEGVMRWFDGYQLSTLELDQNSSQNQNE